MASGKARGFGEIHIGNRSNAAPNDLFERLILLDIPVAWRMYKLANVHSGFFQIPDNRDSKQ